MLSSDCNNNQDFFATISPMLPITFALSPKSTSHHHNLCLALAIKPTTNSDHCKQLMLHHHHKPAIITTFALLFFYSCWNVSHGAQVGCESQNIHQSAQNCDNICNHPRQKFYCQHIIAAHHVVKSDFISNAESDKSGKNHQGASAGACQKQPTKKWDEDSPWVQTNSQHWLPECHVWGEFNESRFDSCECQTFWFG